MNPSKENPPTERDLRRTCIGAALVVAIPCLGVGLWHLPELAMLPLDLRVPPEYPPWLGGAFLLYAAQRGARRLEQRVAHD